MVPIFYSLAVIFWVSGFDIIYALQDEDFDRQHNLKSIPTLMGTKGALKLSEVLHAFSAIFVILPIFYLSLSWLYIIGIVLYVFLLIYQHRIVSPNDLSRVDRAFMTTNGVASVVFAIFFLLDILLLK